MKQGQNGWRIAPVLIVQSVERSVCSYRNKLGFQIIGTFGSPLEMASVGREGVQLMLQDGEGKPRPGVTAATSQSRGTPTSGSRTSTRSTMNWECVAQRS
jgi:hypothetical protein